MNVVITAQKVPLLFKPAGLLLGFGFARLNTRLIRAHKSWWPFKDIERKGFHLHHAVFGIMLMVVAGTTFIGANPDDLRWTSGLAFFFGVGVGLVLDELALARPNSPWARARYRGKPAKIAHARKREAAWAGRKRRIQEFIGGRPTAKRTGSGS